MVIIIKIPYQADGHLQGCPSNERSELAPVFHSILHSYSTNDTSTCIKPYHHYPFRCLIYRHRRSLQPSLCDQCLYERRGRVQPGISRSL